MSDAILADIRVLDLGSDVPGPYCAKMLADYGAEVIKVEDPAGGDPARRVGPFPDDVPHQEKSGLFLHLNTNKRGITLDLRTSRGQELLKELAKRADVLVENYLPGYLDSLGLGWEELEKLNPKLVMTSITPFGQDGPYRDYAAEEIVVFAMSSRMWTHGQPGREPLRYAPDIAWFQVGATAALASMAGIFASERFGIGQQIDVSALEALVGNVDSRVLSYSMTRVKPQARQAQGLGGFGGVVPCLDGYIYVQGFGQRIAQTAQAIGQPELAQDPRFATPQAVAENRDELEAIIMPWLLERTRQEVFAQLQAYGIQCAPVHTLDEVFTDPQTVARNFFVEVEHPEAGRLLYPGAPFIMSDTPWAVRRPAPLLGQHNEEVLCGELGLTQEELRSLRAASVI